MGDYARLAARGNEVTIRWIPTHSGVVGNEIMDGFAKKAACSRQRRRALDELSREASLSHLARVATENRSRATTRWISDNVRPERRYRPPASTGLRRRALCRVRKSLTSRYYQLFTGHAAIDSLLHERMTGPPRLEMSECSCKPGSPVLTWVAVGRWRMREVGTEVSIVGG